MAEKNEKSLVDKLDFELVREVEGGQRKKAYVPLERGDPYEGNGAPGPKAMAKGSSGVTVATGFDIGQWSKDELNKLPINDTTRGKLQQFAELKGPAALKALERSKGLKLEDHELNEIDRVVPEHVLSKFVKAYEEERKRAKGPTPFEELPKEICTAMYSFAHQYGAEWGPKKKGEAAFAQAFWTHITAQKWSEATKVLRSYREGAWRRGKEADFIEKGLKPIKPQEGATTPPKSAPTSAPKSAPLRTPAPTPSPRPTG